MAVRNCLILRTNRLDEQARALLDGLATVRDAEVVVCADESVAPLATEPYRKASFTKEAIANLRIHTIPTMGWQCGDYFLYVAQEIFPEFDFYWLIEPDILFSFKNIDNFFSLFSQSNADLLAARWGPRHGNWNWYEGAAHFFGPSVHGCFVSCARFSQKAGLHLLAERQRLSAMAEARRGRAWPNDEAFVGSALFHGGFECLDLNKAAGILVYDDTFRTNDPILLETYEGKPPANRIVHPILPREQFLQKLERMVRSGGVKLTTEHERIIGSHFSDRAADLLPSLRTLQAAAIARRQRQEAARA